MNNDLVATFLSTTYSMRQARARLRSLRDYLISSIYQPRTNQPPSGDQDPWLLSLGNSFFEGFNEENVYQHLQFLETAIKNITPLILYLAFDMPDTEVNKMGLWLRTNIKNDLVFETKIDPNIIAGCAMSWKGMYKDYSLRARIDENKDKILINLKNFSK